MALGDLALGELARRCREETVRFLRGEPREDAFCFEIFQRAVVGRDDQAWAAIVAQYRGIVLAYVRQHVAAATVREDDDYWVNRAFQRLWSAVGPERFSSFPDLAALLKYLKLCVHSVVMDEVRSRRAGALTSLDEMPEAAPADSRADAEHSAIGKLAGEQLWAAIARELQNEAEERVIHLSFARDMKPAEIFERHPELFASVDDVYRIKRNVLDRLRRSASVRGFLPA